MGNNLLIGLFLIGWSSLLINGDKSCNKILHELADGQNHFMFCVTTNSVPVNVCTACEPKYTDMVVQYEQLVQNCQQIYFDNDRMNIVPETQKILTGLWSMAYCDDCFSNNHAETFLEKSTIFYTCYANNKNTECHKCFVQYQDLNLFYKKLDQKNKGRVCYDLQDSMNRTRKLWSTCEKHDYRTFFFLTTCSIICSLPLIFYFSSYALVKRNERLNAPLIEAAQTETTQDVGALPSASASESAAASATGGTQQNDRSSLVKLKHDSSDSDYSIDA